MVETLITPDTTNISIMRIRNKIMHIWEHPLVNDETRKHRVKARQNAEVFFSQLGVLDQVVCAPMGSFLWCPDGESDYDMSLITKNFDLFKFLNINSNAIKEKTKLHIYPVRFLSNINLIDGFEPFEFLLTPDNYIIGNIGEARELRLKIVNDLAQKDDIENLWNSKKSLLNRYFNINYRDWSLINNGTPFNVVDRLLHRKKDRCRKSRFEKNLDKRAKESNINQDVWKTKYIEALKKFQLPSFEDYRKAVMATDGKLSINTRYK